MAYNVNFTDPFKSPFNVSDDDADGPLSPIDQSTSAQTSLIIYGKGSPNYGERIQENLVHMLENFSGPSLPVNPLQGQMWFSRHEHVLTSGNIWWQWNGTTWNTITVPTSQPALSNGVYWLDGSILKKGVVQINNPLTGTFQEIQYVDLSGVPIANPNTSNYTPANILKVFNGNDWADANSVRVSDVQPPVDEPGALWYDTINNQLKISLDGSTFVVADPGYLRTDGTVPMAATLDLGTNRIINVLDPIAVQDAATRGFVENQIAAAALSIPNSVIANISWREPVTVKDSTPYANNAAFPTTGTIDGVSLAANDRVLFSNVTTVADRKVWVWDGASNWTIDPTNTRTIGDSIYVQHGSNAGEVFAFDENDDWTLITGQGGGGSTTITRELFEPPLTTPELTAGNTLLSLTFPYEQTATGVNLTVFVDGVKYYPGATVGYVETSPTSITFNSPLVGTETIEVFTYDKEFTTSASINRETVTGLTGTPVITFVGLTYVTGSNGLFVYLNGQKMIAGDDYTETGTNNITWIGTPLITSDIIEVYSGVPVIAGTQLSDVSNVSASLPSNGEVLSFNSSLQLWVPVSVPGITSGMFIDELVQNGAGTNTLFGTINVTCQAKDGTRSYIQVFVNGVLQKEGIGATESFQVVSPAQILFNAGFIPPANADVTIYQL